MPTTNLVSLVMGHVRIAASIVFVSSRSVQNLAVEAVAHPGDRIPARSAWSVAAPTLAVPCAYPTTK